MAIDLDAKTLAIARKVCGRRALRRLRIISAESQGAQLTYAEVMSRFGVSRATAMRDLAAVRQASR